MRRFFDTNVLVYLVDSSTPRKRARSQELFAEAVRQGVALLSTQVLQEFFSVVTRKLPARLSHEVAAQAVRDFAQLPVVRVEPEMILSAIEAMRRHRLSFWDSLIVQPALRGGATILYTEDLQSGRAIETLTVEDPFQSLKGTDGL
jgi:predicted nucleic acid-binding protein